MTGEGFRRQSYLAAANISKLLGEPESEQAKYLAKVAAIDANFTARFMQPNGTYVSWCCFFFPSRLVSYCSSRTATHVKTGVDSLRPRAWQMRSFAAQPIELYERWFAQLSYFPPCQRHGLRHRIMQVRASRADSDAVRPIDAHLHGYGADTAAITRSRHIGRHCQGGQRQVCGKLSSFCSQFVSCGDPTSDLTLCHGHTCCLSTRFIFSLFFELMRCSKLCC